MALYIVKNCPIRKGGAAVPIGGTVELADNETAGIEDFLEAAPNQPASKVPNAGEVIAMVQAAQTLDELEKLAEGEERKTVTAAIEKRRVELTKPQTQTETEV